VLFNSYPFFYARDARRPAILALYADDFIGEVRIKPFLNALLARGLIADYQVVDRSMTMFGPLKSYQFTHIWCQRNMSTAQFRFLKRHPHVPIIYDIDDLITSIPDFVMRVKQRTRTRIDWCLHHAKAITVATEALRVSLREDVPALPGEVVVLSNGCTSAVPPASNGPNNSNSVISNAIEAIQATISLGWNWNSSWLAQSVLSKCRCSTSTPFGEPVEPEV